MENMEHLERARDFYVGRSIFLTGFTGYVGKVLAEKLLWICPDIKCIYILVRGNRKKTSQERLKQIYDLILFDRLRERDGEKWMDKLIPIEGDVSKENLGLVESELNLIANSVSIVFHSAAYILFNDPLTVPVGINTLGTKNLCDFALRMHKLECFLYISTAFSNCHNFTVDEKVYPPLAEWKDVLKICDKVDPGAIAILTEKYISPQPNTYVFSKQITESIVDSYKEELPVCIVRPSVIVPAWKTPMPGWSDSKFGTNLPFIGGISGIMTSMLEDPDSLIDAVYVDWVANGCALAGIQRSKFHKKLEETPVYNVSLYDQSITNEVFTQHSRQKLIEEDIIKCGFRINCRFMKSKFWFIADYLPRSVISSFIVDFLLRLFKKPQIVTKIRRTIYEMVFVLHYFTSNTFHIKNFKFKALLKSTHPEEIDELGYLLSLDPKDRHEQIKQSFYDGYLIGMKKVVGKELYDRADELKTYIRLLYFLDASCFYLFYFLLFYIGSKLFTPTLAITAAVLFAIGYHRNANLIHV